MGWGFWKIGFWRRYLGLRGTRNEGNWRKLHSEEIHDFHSSPNVIRVIKWRRMRWAGNVARMGDRRCAYRASIGKFEGNNQLGKPMRNGMMKWKWIFKKKDVRKWTRLTWITIRTGDGVFFLKRWWGFGFRKLRGIPSKRRNCLSVLHRVTYFGLVCSVDLQLTNTSGDSP